MDLDHPGWHAPVSSGWAPKFWDIPSQAEFDKVRAQVDEPDITEEMEERLKVDRDLMAARNLYPAPSVPGAGESHESREEHLLHRRWSHLPHQAVRLL